MIIGVADEHIGVIVGRGGRNIMEISQVWSEMFLTWICLFVQILNRIPFLQVTGARIKISDRGDFMSGTSDRYKIGLLKCPILQPRGLVSMYG